MQRFFLPDLHPTPALELRDTSIVHQLSHVLRAAPGDEIVLFNGDGLEYQYRIGSISKKSIQCGLESKRKNHADPEVCIRLYQAMPNKYEKIEYILQKGVEVGVSEFVFFRSDRSQKLVINDRKIERFQEIVREALEQCGGNRMPELIFSEEKNPVTSDGTSLVFHTESSESIGLSEVSTVSPLNIHVGPEGGWSPSEMAYFQEKGVQIVHLGSRILRTETTGTVAAFFLLQK